MDDYIVFVMIIMYYCALSPLTFMYFHAVAFGHYYLLTAKSVKNILFLKAVIEKNDLLIQEILRTIPPDVRENILKDCLINDPKLYIALMEILKDL